MIISISGKKRSGKDLIGKIINYLISTHGNTNVASFESCLKHKSSFLNHADWKTVKFADKLKDMVCLLIGCTREQLEDEVFKNTVLGEEWKIWKYELDLDANLFDGNVLLDNNRVFASKEEAEIFKQKQNLINVVYIYSKLIIPREILQYVGTDLFRNQFHPNTWVNATMADYYRHPKNGDYIINKNTDGPINIGNCPSWIITDVRFENEVKAVKDRGGINIRVNRPEKESNDLHESETSLDSYDKWDAIITNDGNIEELVKKIKEILIKFKII